MKRAVKLIVILLAFVFVAIQFIRPGFTNPPVVESDRLQASMAVPEDVIAILRRSCNDCHTNETVYPWYSQISPVSWWLNDHIQHGREHLNFSTWAGYTDQQKIKRLEEICEVVESGEMPLPSYTWGHPEAVLSQVDSKTLCGWARSVQTEIVERQKAVAPESKK